MWIAAVVTAFVVLGLIGIGYGLGKHAGGVERQREEGERRWWREWNLGVMAQDNGSTGMTTDEEQEYIRTGRIPKRER